MIQKIDPDAQPILSFAVYGAARSQKELTEIADKQVKQVLETRQGRRLGQLQRRAQARDPAAAERRPAQRLRPDRRSGAHRRRSARTSRCPAAASSPARPKSRCARWAGSRTSTTSTGSSWPTGDGSVDHLRRRRPRPGQRAGGAQRDAARTARRRSASRSASSRAPTPSRSSTASWPGSSRSSATLPPDLQISIGNDQSRFIRRSFEDIKMHLLLGGLLASVVVFLFIRNLRVTLHRRARHPDLDHRHVHLHEDVRLHAEQHDDAGAVAGDRHRHRRRDRRAREHLPVRRGEGRHAEGGGGRGDAARSAWR